MYLIYLRLSSGPGTREGKDAKQYADGHLTTHRKLKGYPYTHHPNCPHRKSNPENQGKRTIKPWRSNTKFIDWPTKASIQHLQSCHSTDLLSSQCWCAELPSSKSPHCLLLVWEYPLVPWKYADQIHMEMFSKSQNKQINLMALHTHAHMHSRTHSMCRYIVKARNRCPSSPAQLEALPITPASDGITVRASALPTGCCLCAGLGQQLWIQRIGWPDFWNHSIFRTLSDPFIKSNCIQTYFSDSRANWSHISCAFQMV